MLGLSRKWIALLVAAIAAAIFLGCASETRGTGVGLLAGIAPHKSSGVQRPESISDGVIGRPGDPWDSHLAAVLSPSSFVEWDLGESRTIRSAFLQGDNNDDYLVQVSDDGSSWAPLWTAPPATTGRGLQPRTGQGFEGRGRYVRLSPARGDGSYSVTELALFEAADGAATSDLTVKRGLPIGELHRSAIILFGLALVAFVVVAQRGSPWLTLAMLLIPLIAGYRVYESFVASWPVGQREVSMVRAVAAFVALAAVAREVFAPKRFPASRPAVLGTLGFAAVMAIAGFFNLLHPQFWDAKNGKPNAVHNYDMRVYFPVAKYFKELRFDGLYLGSVAAYVDDVPNASLQSLARTELRDLKTHHMRRVSEVEQEILAVKNRFSPERWQEFVTDMRYFRETMGDRGYLGSMTDHGGNATPVWLATGHLIFAKTNASNETLLTAALLDPLLLLFAFFAIWRTFGVRTALISAVVFGANDFYMFGSNWAGATLRHDWMAYLALGACALKRERWMLGGALLAWSAMIRAFPAFALVGAALPAAWWIGEHYLRHKKLPSIAQFRKEQEPILKIAAGAAICVGAFFLLSVALFGAGAWSEWLAKVAILDRDPHTNHVSLRGLVAGNDAMHLFTLNARMPLFVTLVALSALLVVAAARGKHPSRAALLGTILIPVAFNPANYYIHFVFVLPLLAIEKSRAEQEPDESPLELRDFGIWAILLTICVLQYWTVLAPDWELHFQLATVILFFGLAAMLITMLRYDWPLLPALAAAGSERPEEEPEPEEADDDDDEGEGRESEPPERESAPDSEEPDQPSSSVED
jgi:hypothetical protein